MLNVVYMCVCMYIYCVIVLDINLTIWDQFLSYLKKNDEDIFFLFFSFFLSVLNLPVKQSQKEFTWRVN